MDVPLVLLRDRATVGGSVVRCARIQNTRRDVSTVIDDDGRRVRFSVELVFRRASKPAVGDVVVIGSVSGRVAVVRDQDSPGPWMRCARAYVSTLTDIVGGELDTSVTVYASVESTDAYSTVVRVPSLTGVVMDARLDVVSTDESHSDGQRRTGTVTLTVAESLAVYDAYSRVVHSSGVYAFDGDPVVHDDPTGVSWSTVTVKRIGDGVA